MITRNNCNFSILLKKKKKKLWFSTCFCLLSCSELDLVPGFLSLGTIVYLRRKSLFQWVQPRLALSASRGSSGRAGPGLLKSIKYQKGKTCCLKPFNALNLTNSQINSWLNCNSDLSRWSQQRIIQNYDDVHLYVWIIMHTMNYSKLRNKPFLLHLSLDFFKHLPLSQTLTPIIGHEGQAIKLT